MLFVICRRYEEEGRSKKTKAEASSSTRIKQRAPRCRCVMVYVGLAQQESGAEGGGHGRREGTHDGRGTGTTWMDLLLPPQVWDLDLDRSGTCPETQYVVVVDLFAWGWLRMRSAALDARFLDS